MKLFTWNILHQDYADDHVQPWHQRIKKIREIIRLHSADIVCLQEVDFSTALEDFAEFKDYHCVVQCQKSKLKKLKQYNDLIQSNNLTQPISATNLTQPISATDSTQTKPKKPDTIACVTLVKKEFGSVVSVGIASRSLTTVINAKDKLITVTNVHLEAGKNTTALHIKHLEKLLHSDIICGDFNDFPDEPAIKFLEEKNYTNAYSVRMPPCTFKGNTTTRVLDYVFFRGKIMSITWADLQSANVDTQQSANVDLTESFPSDHAYLIAELDY